MSTEKNYTIDGDLITTTILDWNGYKREYYEERQKIVIDLAKIESICAIGAWAYVSAGSSNLINVQYADMVQIWKDFKSKIPR